MYSESWFAPRALMGLQSQRRTLRCSPLGLLVRDSILGLRTAVHSERGQCHLVRDSILGFRTAVHSKRSLCQG